MKAEWMANVGGEEYGPFTWDQMLQMAGEGRVTPDLPVRKVSQRQWSTAAAVPGLLGGERPANGRAVSKATPTSAGKSGLKKARPLAPPPVGRALPPVVTARPGAAGIPVGMPAGPAASNQTEAAAPFSLDVTSSPVNRSRSAKSILDDDDELPDKRKNGPLLIVGILGGAIGLVAIVAGLIVYITMNGNEDHGKIAATNISAGAGHSRTAVDEVNPGEVQAEGEAEDHPSTKKALPVTQADKSKKSGATPAAAAAQQAALKSIRDWKNVATLRSVGVGNARVAISRVWLAVDSSGAKAEAVPREGAPPEAAAETKPAEAAPAGDAASKPKFVFVEVTISNKAGATLKYKGWNVAKNSAPFMADDHEHILKLVPTAETPQAARLAKSEIRGGGAVNDILVFEAPSGTFEKLRLVLPQNVFYDKTRNPYFGLEITSDVLENEGGPPVIPPPPTGTIAGDDQGNPLVSGRKLPIDPATSQEVIPAEDPKPASKEPAKKEEPPARKPSLVDEINRSFEEQEKAALEKKSKEPARPEEPENPFVPVKPKTNPEPAKPQGKK